MLRIAVSQFRPTKGEYAQNVDRIAGVLAQAMALEVPPALVVFPETATSGYFVEGGVKDVAVTAGTLFRDLQTRYEPLGAPPVDVAVGFYEVFQNHISTPACTRHSAAKRPKSGTCTARSSCRPTAC